jgi:hypothetical protein
MRNNTEPSGSLNTLEILLIMAICFMDKGYFTDWTPPLFPIMLFFHLFTVVLNLHGVNPRSDLLAYTVIVDFLSFTAQYCVQFEVIADDYHWDKFHARDGSLKNWVKIGLIGGALLFDVVRSIYMCTRSYTAENNKRSDDEYTTEEVIVEKSAAPYPAQHNTTMHMRRQLPLC